MLQMSDIYGQLLTWLLSPLSIIETNKRTGVRVRVGNGPTSFRIDLADRLLPTVGLRKTFPRSAAAEVAWFLQGTQDATFIRKYAPLWDKFVEPISRPADQVTNEVFEGVKAAYGYRWRQHFDRDQLALALLALAKDPTDRRVWVQAWDPSEDGLGAQGQRNVPCPIGFTLSITGGRLHSALVIRSSDVFVGLPYDVMGHALLMDAIAASLNVELGYMSVQLGHAHLYECHWEMAKQCLTQQPVVPPIVMPGYTVAKIEAEPDAYVQVLANKASGVFWPNFNPRPEVVE